MLHNLKNRIITGWSLMRFIRLSLALTIIIQAVISSEILFAVLGGFLLFQAAFNYGCCGSGGCDINHNTTDPKSSGAKEEVITFNEVK
jgi:hypothetical protein